MARQAVYLLMFLMPSPRLEVWTMASYNIIWQSRVSCL